MYTCKVAFFENRPHKGAVFVQNGSLIKSVSISTWCNTSQCHGQLPAVFLTANGFLLG